MRVLFIITMLNVSLNDIHDLIRTVITYEIPTELAFKTIRRITKS